MPFINVKDYGVVGDGVSDDTASINNAFLSATPGSIIEFPTGTYKINGSIILESSDVIIEGYKATLVQTSLNKKTIEIKNSNNTTVRDLKFIGLGTENLKNTTSYNGVAAIFLRDSENCKVYNCVIENHAGGGIRWTGDCEGLQVLYNTVEGIGTTSILNGDNGNDICVGGYLTQNEKNISIIGNNLSKHCFGIFLDNSDSTIISDNLIHDIPGQHGMYLSNCSNLLVTNNIIHNTAYTGINNQINNPDRVLKGNTIQNNLIHNTGRSGISFNVTDIALSSSKYSITLVSNNNLHNIGEYGIFVKNCVKTCIINNYIDEINNYGIIAQGFSGDISNNNIHHTGWNAILASLLNETIIKNNILSENCLNNINDYRTDYCIYASQNVNKETANPLLILISNIVSTNDVLKGWLYTNTNYSNIDNIVTSNTTVIKGIYASLLNERLL